MAQNFTPDWYELTYVVDTAFQNAENNDNALRSNFSGSNAPSSPVIGQHWFDIDTGTMKVYEVDSQWIASLVGGADFRVWLYTNDQQRGMLIDTGVTDAVIALRGGNYGSSGGVVLGNWNNVTGVSADVPGAGSEHFHKWKEYRAGDNRDYSWGGNGILELVMGVNLLQRPGLTESVTEGNAFAQSTDYYTRLDSSHTHPNASVSSNSTWRPRAAVGTMQYPNLA